MTGIETDFQVDSTNDTSEQGNHFYIPVIGGGFDLSIRSVYAKI
jgi:hypothetical protein